MPEKRIRFACLLAFFWKRKKIKSGRNVVDDRNRKGIIQKIEKLDRFKEREKIKTYTQK